MTFHTYNFTNHDKCPWAPSHRFDLGNTAALRTGERGGDSSEGDQGSAVVGCASLPNQTNDHKGGKGGRLIAEISKDPGKASVTNAPLVISVYESLFTAAHRAQLLDGPLRGTCETQTEPPNNLLRQKEQML